jgi:hypothetical protein
LKVLTLRVKRLADVEHAGGKIDQG